MQTHHACAHFQDAANCFSDVVREKRLTASSTAGWCCVKCKEVHGGVRRQQTPCLFPGVEQYGSRWGCSIKNSSFRHQAAVSDQVGAPYASIRTVQPCLDLACARRWLSKQHLVRCSFATALAVRSRPIQCGNMIMRYAATRSHPFLCVSGCFATRHPPPPN